MLHHHKNIPPVTPKSVRRGSITDEQGDQEHLNRANGKRMISARGEQRDGDIESPRRLPDMAGADAPPPQVRKNILPVTPQSVRRRSITDYFEKLENSCTDGSIVNHESCHGS